MLYIVGGMAELSIVTRYFANDVSNKKATEFTYFSSVVYALCVKPIQGIYNIVSVGGEP